MSKKVNLFTATKSFTEDVAMFMVKSVWRSEYREELQEAIEQEIQSMKGLENMRGSAIMTDEQVNLAQAECAERIEKYRKAHAEVVSEWVRYAYPDDAKALYKGYAVAKSEDDVKTAFVGFLSAHGLSVSVESELVVTLTNAVKGDSSGSNIKQFVETGVASVDKRKRAEFLKIVYRRLFDAMVMAGTIRVIGCTIRAGGKDCAELAVEIPPMTRARHLKDTQKKSAK